MLPILAKYERPPCGPRRRTYVTSVSIVVGLRSPRPANPVDLSSASKNALRMCGVCRSVHSTSAFVHAAFRAARTFHLTPRASAEVGSPPRASNTLEEALREVAIDVRVHAGQRELETGNPAVPPRTQKRTPGGRRTGGSASPAAIAAKYRLAKTTSSSDINRGSRTRSDYGVSAKCELSNDPD
jgi:hypothetical protein